MGDISFTLDKTAPVLSISSMEEGINIVSDETSAAKIKVSGVDVHDVEIYQVVDGVQTKLETTPVNDMENNNVYVDIDVTPDNSYTFVAKDKAGNVSANKVINVYEKPTVKASTDLGDLANEEATSKDVTITATGKDVTITSKVQEVTNNISSGDKLSDSGIYEINAVDKFGASVCIKFTIDKVILDKPVFSLYTVDDDGSNKTPYNNDKSTKKNVLVEINYPSNPNTTIGHKYYSVVYQDDTGNIEKAEYSSGIVLQKNATVTAYAQSHVGVDGQSESITVDKIDKVAPSLTVVPTDSNLSITNDKTSATKLTISATDSDSVKLYYKEGSGSYNEITDVTAIENGK